jgi:hypothetical protein
MSLLVYARLNYPNRRHLMQWAHGDRLIAVNATNDCSRHLAVVCMAHGAAPSLSHQPESPLLGGGGTKCRGRRRGTGLARSFLEGHLSHASACSSYPHLRQPHRRPCPVHGKGKRGDDPTRDDWHLWRILKPKVFFFRCSTNLVWTGLWSTWVWVWTGAQ